MYIGIPASKGYAKGIAFLIQNNKIEISQEIAEFPQKEMEDFENAVSIAMKQLEAIREKTKKEMGEEESLVFESHLMMLEDPEFLSLIKTNIAQKGYNAAYAVQTVTDYFVSFLENMEDEYMKARAADIKDVGNRMIRIILRVESSTLKLPDNVIIIAEDLTPSDTAQLDKSKVRAFVTQVGSKTSHSAIMARSMGIPAVLGVSNIVGSIKNGSNIIVDGFTGQIHVEPSYDIIEEYEKRMMAYTESKKTLDIYKEVELEYVTGRKLEVAGNIGCVDDLDMLVAQGANGVGLFRTEFLFMGKSHMPSEEEQFDVYKTVGERMNGKPVVIRTLDIGGDKVIPYMNMLIEDNPFLGLRALRLCFKEIEIFKTQLKAILRAAVYGNLHIMFPMIGSVNELTRAKAILDQCKKELEVSHIKFNSELPVGMMIEIPSAAIISEELAKEVDFFSIGTNDLVQYTLAVDRMNKAVSYLYDHFHPAVLQLIKLTIQSAHQAGIWCGMCGEMASDLDAVALLANMGLDEFSVTGNMVLEIKEHLLKQSSVKEKL